MIVKLERGVCIVTSNHDRFFWVAPLAGSGQIVIYTAQPCGTILKPGQRANGGTHAAFISCEIQWHQILNTSLWSTACLVPHNSHLNLQQPEENKKKKKRNTQ